MSKSLFERIRFKLGCNAQNDRLFQVITCTYSLRKVQEVEFLIFLIDTAKPTINISNLMTENKNQNLLYT